MCYYAEGFQNYQNAEIIIYLKQIYKVEVLFAFKTLKFMFAFFLHNHDLLELCFKVRAEILIVTWLRGFIKSTPIKSIGSIDSAFWN